MSIRQEKENGMPVARIARRYGISRQSVYNVVNGVFGSGRERVARPSVLDAFKPYVRSRLARFDLPATVLLREIQRQGYGGGISILKAFVAGVTTDLVRLVIERSRRCRACRRNSIGTSAASSSSMACRGGCTCSCSC